MSVYELELSGLRVVSLNVTMSIAGTWVADLELADDTPVDTSPFSAVLAIGNLSLVGTVVRQDSLGGSRHVRLVGGAGGWAKVLPPVGYHRDGGGVTKALVLGDLATLTGERLAIESDADLGEDFERPQAPALRTLEQLVGKTWWIDEKGMTHTEPRPTGAPIASPHLIEDYDGGAGRIVASTEDYASWVPGAVVELPWLTTPQTLSTVTIRVGENSDSVRIVALVGAQNRALDPLRAIIQEQFERAAFFVPWEYTIDRAYQRGGVWRFDARAIAPMAPAPDLGGVVLPQFLALGGLVVPTAGEKILVGFVNGQPNRPFILAYDSAAPEQIAWGTSTDNKSSVALSAKSKLKLDDAATSFAIDVESVQQEVSYAVSCKTVQLDATMTSELASAQGSATSTTTVAAPSGDAKASVSVLGSNSAKVETGATATGPAEIDLTATGLPGTIKLTATGPEASVTIEVNGVTLLLNEAMIAKLNALP
jgi:hypothetical protein